MALWERDRAAQFRYELLHHEVYRWATPMVIVEPTHRPLCAGVHELGELLLNKGTCFTTAQLSRAAVQFAAVDIDNVRIEYVDAFLRRLPRFDFLQSLEGAFAVLAKVTRVRRFAEAVIAARLLRAVPYDQMRLLHERRDYQAWICATVYQCCRWMDEREQSELCVGFSGPFLEVQASVWAEWGSPKGLENIVLAGSYVGRYGSADVRRLLLPWFQAMAEHCERAVSVAGLHGVATMLEVAPGSADAAQLAAMVVRRATWLPRRGEAWLLREDEHWVRRSRYEYEESDPGNAVVERASCDALSCVVRQGGFRDPGCRRQLTELICALLRQRQRPRVEVLALLVEAVTHRCFEPQQLGNILEIVIHRLPSMRWRERRAVAHVLAAAITKFGVDIAQQLLEVPRFLDALISVLHDIDKKRQQVTLLAALAEFLEGARRLDTRARSALRECVTTLPARNWPDEYQRVLERL